jgi:hypothetical protein
MLESRPVGTAELFRDRLRRSHCSYAYNEEGGLAHTCSAKTQAAPPFAIFRKVGTSSLDSTRVARCFAFAAKGGHRRHVSSRYPNNFHSPIVTSNLVHSPSLARSWLRL